jgi:osmotically-inducible protein OsmY
MEKIPAEGVAKRVLGVKAVANDVEVRPLGTGVRADTDIAQTALDALRWKSHHAGDRLKVSVSKGWVTLEGDVDWHYQKGAAEEAVRPLLGVRGVLNQIVIKPSASAAEVKTRIEASFKRTAELDAKKVRVETRDGKVTLKGEVRSWAELEGSERTAWAAPGVTAVDNQLVVSPYLAAV